MGEELERQDSRILDDTNIGASPVILAAWDNGDLILDVSDGRSGRRIARLAKSGATSWELDLRGVLQTNDVLEACHRTPDEGVVLFYTSSAPSGGLKMAPAYGFTDFWMVCINAAGQKIWDRSFGGADREELLRVASTEDGGFLLCGRTASDQPSGNKTKPGVGTWIVKVSANGIKQSELVVPEEFATVDVLGSRVALVTSAVGTNRLRSLRSYVAAQIEATANGDRCTIEVSEDLKTWRALVTEFRGSVELREQADRPQLFYRVTKIDEQR